MGYQAELLQRVVPSELVRKALGPADPFVVTYGDAPLLCIDLSGSPDGDLELGLESSLDATTGAHQIGFHTVVGGSQVVDPEVSGGFTAVELSKRLHAHRHFMLPLAKRNQESMSMDRIVVGRARNKDVVLRHQSVSKFPAWFELDAEGTVRVADAGSTNGTKLDGRRLEPKELTEVPYGAQISFGSVSCFVCDPMLVWEAFHR